MSLLFHMSGLTCSDHLTSGCVLVQTHSVARGPTPTPPHLPSCTEPSAAVTTSTFALPHVPMCTSHAVCALADTAVRARDSRAAAA
jgi:hypothetical protein